MRPRLWLKLISENRGTISSSPPFGYALCAKRLRWSDCDRYDLSSWRVACGGAERIHAEPLEKFAELLKANGFKPEARVRSGEHTSELQSLMRIPYAVLRPNEKRQH